MFDSKPSSDRNFKRMNLSSQLVVTLAAVFLTILALSVVGLLISGDNGSKQPPSAPNSGNHTYIPGGVVPTTQWVNFYGLNSLLDGQRLPVGSVITALDPQGVVCGEFTVTQGGRYGLMPVYGDDPSTNSDEGAVPGDSIQFRINGIQAEVVGPDEPAWTEMGDLKQVNMTANTPD